ncbi:50S ribosomal protein L21 [Babesia ovis]|uniref:50S ribosomal protein L21 n=1 Tax=Babesia ovis TaxID=5869 RepID=A0A9W5TE26_BABOV|nr:50S ribosomal protein L21 [Babesia ovis]
MAGTNIVMLVLMMCAGVGTGVQRRDYSLGSTLVRLVTDRTDYERGDAENARVTQAPVVKIHLKKIILPTLIHGAMKNDINQQLVERAGDLDRDNERTREAIKNTIKAIDELESLAGEPLSKMNAHNYTEREYKTQFSEAHEPEKRFAAILQEPYGLSDFAVISQRPTNGAPEPYMLFERSRLKPSEMDEEDSERQHLPLFSREDGYDRSGSYAVVHISGVPRWFERGRFYDVNRIQQQVGASVYLHRVAFFQSEDGWYVHGEPYLENVRIKCKIMKHFRGPKQVTYKFRPKKHYKRKIGFRPELTRLEVESFEVLPHGERWVDTDPIYVPLIRIEQLRKPSTELHKMKRNTIYKLTPTETEMLKGDPLAHFDPVYNQLFVENRVMTL